MDAKGSARAAPADAKKKKSTTRVKVVASRYAQALQTKNLEAQAHRRSTRASSATPTEKTNAVVAREASKSASGAASAAVTRVKMPRPSPLSSTRAPAQAAMATPSPAASAIETALTPASTHRPVAPSAGSAATASEASIAASNRSDKQDLKERLLAYKASKALAAQKRPTPARASIFALPAPSTTVNPVKAAKTNTTPRERPTFPKRIAPTTIERSGKRPAKVPSEPIPSETRVLARPPTPRARQIASVASATAQAAPRGTPSEEEELELLEAMYYQLCFTELKAEEAFRRQEQAAEAGCIAFVKQIIVAWNLLQSKLQLLHDTSLRLDREKHTLSVEQNIGDQAAPFVHVTSKLPEFVANLSRVSASLETSLHRLPTPGVRCDPVNVQQRLNALTIELDELLQQIQATKLDTEISNAVLFEHEMSRGVEQIGVSLLQVANLVEHLLQEVNTETSMAIQRIQEQRAETSVTRDDWW